MRFNPVRRKAFKKSCEAICHSNIRAAQKKALDNIFTTI